MLISSLLQKNTTRQTFFWLKPLPFQVPVKSSNLYNFSVVLDLENAVNTLFKWKALNAWRSKYIYLQI